MGFSELKTSKIKLEIIQIFFFQQSLIVPKNSGTNFFYFQHAKGHSCQNYITFSEPKITRKETRKTQKPFFLNGIIKTPNFLKNFRKFFRRSLILSKKELEVRKTLFPSQKLKIMGEGLEKF